MIYRHFIYYILFVAYILSGCCNKANDSVRGAINIDLTKSCDCSDSDLFEDVRLIKLNTGDDFIGCVDKVVWCDDQFVVLDKQQNKVFVFDENGKIQTIINRVGRGPNEYLSIGDIDCKEGVIFIFDDSSYRLCRYDMAGEFLGTNKVCEGYHIAVMDDGVAVYAGEDAEEFELITFNEQCEQSGSYLEVDDVLNSLPITFVNETSLSKCEDEILLTRYFDYTVYSLKDNSVEPKYKFSFGSDNFDPAILSFSTPQEFQKNVIQSQGVLSIDYLLETPRWLTFQAGDENVYYNKASGNYVLRGQLPTLSKVLLSYPAMAYNSQTGYFCTKLTSSNVANAIIPLLTNNPSGFEGLDNIVNQSTDESDNDWLVLFKMRW
ncbi:MAG: 6-bladed beta-propeller [Rikenellaceae bacterium]|nr:6-bladed beta-propeller [Rikenellaceae bacterium]